MELRFFPARYMREFQRRSRSCIHLRQEHASRQVGCNCVRSGRSRVALPARQRLLAHSGSQILDASGRPVRIAGISWFGFETSDQIVHGLWNQDYHHILHTIKDSGFNTIRIPSQTRWWRAHCAAARQGPGHINSDLVSLTSLEIMDRIVAQPEPRA